ncbi:hypothetical protein L4C33_14620 [Vibrio makurazakiensis]|uniref:hypothetical protein n=1 Tax=Vibrio makurazakiensis TaxID=2910250 RepID=UPI003D0D0295
MNNTLSTLLNGCSSRYLSSSLGTVRLVHGENINILMYKVLGSKQTISLCIKKQAVNELGLIGYLSAMAEKDKTGDYKIAHQAVSEIINTSLTTSNR